LQSPENSDKNISSKLPAARVSILLVYLSGLP